MKINNILVNNMEKQKLFPVMNLLKKLIMDDNIDINIAIDKLYEKLQSLTSLRKLLVSDINNIVNNTIEYRERIKLLQNNNAIGNTTGFKELDKVTTGFNPGSLTVIGARPDSGKNSFSLNIVSKNIDNNDGVLYFSLDMSKFQIMIRLLSIRTGIPLQKIKNDFLDIEEEQLISQELNKLRNKNLFMNDNGNIKFSELKLCIMQTVQASNNTINLIIIDNLQLVNINSNIAKKEKHSISYDLKLLAKELEVAIVIFSHLKSKLEFRDDKRPLLSDIKSDSSICEVADSVMFIYRDSIYEEREEYRKQIESAKIGFSPHYLSAYVDKPIEKIEIIVRKSYYERFETVPLNFHKETLKYTNF